MPQGTVYWNSNPDNPRGNPWRVGEGMFGGAFQFSQNDGREWIRFDATNGPAIGEDFGLAFWLRVEHADDADRSRTYTIMNKDTETIAAYLPAGETLAPCHGGFKLKRRKVSIRASGRPDVPTLGRLGVRNPSV